MRSLFVQWREVFHQKVFGNSKRDCFPKLSDLIFVNDAYSDFIYRFAGAINFIAPSKRIRVKANSKSWFDNQRRDKLY